jgi:hypothetical protein
MLRTGMAALIVLSLTAPRLPAAQISAKTVVLTFDDAVKSQLTADPDIPILIVTQNDRFLLDS